MAAGEETRLVYFAPEFTETSTIKRVQEFLDAGIDPIVLGFERGRYNRNHSPEWPHYLLGRTRDKRYANRAFALLTAFPVLVRIRAALHKAHVFYARNMDQLILSLLARGFFNCKAAVVYEILDIQPIFTGRGLASRLFRWLEKRCLNFVDLLVVSSPAFYENYYGPIQAYRGSWFLLENKLHESEAATQDEAASGRRPMSLRGRPWVIGYFGLIRGQATLELIERVAGQLRGVVEFHFRGVLTTIDDKQFKAALAQHPNIRYGGEYANPSELLDMYAGVDFAWALDLENIEANSRWLMPCRFYEAGAYGVPCLAAADFEIGRRIDQLGVGWTFKEPFEESIVSFFSTISPEVYEEKRRRLRSLARETFVTGSGDPSLRNEIEALLVKRLRGEALPTTSASAKALPSGEEQTRRSAVPGYSSAR